MSVCVRETAAHVESGFQLSSNGEVSLEEESEFLLRHHLHMKKTKHHNIITHDTAQPYTLYITLLPMIPHNPTHYTIHTHHSFSRKTMC